MIVGAAAGIGDLFEWFRTNTSGTGKGAASDPDPGLAHAIPQPYPLNRWFTEAYGEGSKKALPKDLSKEGKEVKGPRVRIASTGVAVEGVEAGKKITLVFKVPKEQRKKFNPNGLQVQAVVQTYSSQAVTGLVYQQIPPEQVEVEELKYTPASGEIQVKVTVKTNPGPDKPIVLQLGGNSFATLKLDAPQGVPVPAPGGTGKTTAQPAPAEGAAAKDGTAKPPAADTRGKRKAPAEKAEEPAPGNGDEWGAPIK
jgi:hypothetical protein